MSTLVDKCLSWLLPTRCLCCARPLERGHLCTPCIGDLPWNERACARCALPMATTTICPRCLRRAPHFDGAWSAFRLEQPVQHFVHALKYRADFVQAQVLGELMAIGLQKRGELRTQLLIPVPLHASRLRRRGYNQALEIARTVGRRCRIPVGTDAAQRLRATEDQIGQHASARRRNMRNAFAVREDLSGMRVALIDDVMTTGATLDELARVCRDAGAVHIEAWAAARTP